MLYFITNIHGASGNALLVWKKIKKYLVKNQIPFKLLLSEYSGHSAVLANQVCQKKEEDVRLVVVGGDGTINEVINGISDFSNISFGVIPTGSGNDFARGNGIPRKNVIKALRRVIESDGQKKIDLGEVTVFDEKENDGKRTVKFAISSGIGMDAIVCKKAEKSRLKKILNFLKLGSLTYVLLTIQTLFTMKKYDITARFDDEESVDFKGLIYLASMNTPYEGGGVCMAPFASPCDGQLSLCAVNGVPKFVTFFMLPFLCVGKHKIFKSFKLRNFKKLEICAKEPMVLHTDGEYSGDVLKIKYECLPQKLKLL